MILVKLKRTFSKNEHDWQICFVLKDRRLNYLSRKYELVARSTSSAIRFWNSKTLSKLNFEGLSTDSYSNNFSEIYLAYLKIPPPNMPDTGNAKDCLEFLPTNCSIFTLINVTSRTYLISFPVQYCFLFRFVCKSLFHSSDFFKSELQYMFMVLWSICPLVIKKLMQTYIVIVSGSILNVSTAHLNGIWHLIWRYLSKPVFGRTPCIKQTL